MGKALRCPVLKIYIADYECEFSSEYGHHYCQGCSMAKKKDESIAKDNYSYYRLVVGLLQGAIDIVTRGESWIDTKHKYWKGKDGKELSEGERRRFIKDLRECAEIRNDIVETKGWFFSTSTDVGSFFWVCAKLQEFHKSYYNYRPESLLRKLELEAGTWEKKS